MAILVVGSIALDSVQTPSGKRDDVLGGSATYFSLAASYFFPVNVVAVVGEDFPKEYYAYLKKENIDLSGIKVEKGKTFRWKASYTSDINNPRTLQTQLNVFGEFNPKIPTAYKKSKYVFLANIDPDLQFNILGQVENPRIIACDSMNYWIVKKRPSLEKLLSRVDIFFANDSEAKLLASEENLLKAAKFILKLGPQIAVIKKGEHGVLFSSREGSFIVPAYLLEKVVDPTGAGDTFAGGFMGYLSLSGELNDAVVRKAVVYGTIMASFNVESFSADRLANLTKEEIENRYRQFEELTRF